jgi:hypothetical protein
MTSDHHGRITDIATSLLTAVDGIFGTHSQPPQNTIPAHTPSVAN